jgi:flagellar assembly protein FliH
VETVRALQNTKQAWLNQWEKNVVHLAAGIASRVIRRELAGQPEITLDLVREALELAASSGRLKLRLNPQDCQTLGERAKQLAAQISELAPADVVADPNIRPGGCRVDTEFGSIDQQIETQLARIEEELT